jgi:Spy/CpxP family protein refolding chaperone
MKMWMRLVCMALAMTVVSVGVADEKKNKKGKKGPSATQRFVGKMELTDAQKEQVAAIDKQFAEKLATLNKAKADILTDEQKKAEKATAAANKADGKKGADAKKAMDEALKLTDEQKTKMKEWQKSQAEFSASVIESLKKVLTPEQIEQLPKPQGQKKGKKKAA